MTEVVVRLALVLLTVVAAYGAVALWERRRGPNRSPLSPGVTVVTAEGCRLCGPTIDALRAAGIAHRAIDAGHPEARAAGVRSLPTLLVVDPAGRIVFRRSGRAAIIDLARVWEWVA